jgi:hypothetical protein
MGEEAFMCQLAMASATVLLACAIAMSAWRSLLPTIARLVANNEKLAVSDEEYLSLLLVCW